MQFQFGCSDVFFFFSSRRRHTRSYGDWSSDVCSSDLDKLSLKVTPKIFIEELLLIFVNSRTMGACFVRSEERRVGKECRSRWGRDHEKKREKRGEYVERKTRVLKKDELIRGGYVHVMR